MHTVFTATPSLELLIQLFVTLRMTGRIPFRDALVRPVRVRVALQVKAYSHSFVVGISLPQKGKVPSVWIQRVDSSVPATPHYQKIPLGIEQIERATRHDLPPFDK